MARMRGKLLYLVAVIVMTVFSFAALELHADHDLNAKAPVSHCCVQCCPSHHLAPTPKQRNDIGALASASRLVFFHSPFHSVFFPSRIERPPIA